MTIARQVAFTSVMKKADGKNRRCIIDVTLSLNGLPVATAELKNPLTGQRTADAVRQYCDARDERDLLFAFPRWSRNLMSASAPISPRPINCSSTK